MSSYQSRIPDPLYLAVRKFGKLQCTDPRDRLYGLLGLLDDRTRARIKPDYTRDVDYAFRQALQIGLEELCGHRNGRPFLSDGAGYTRLGYYCDLRDAFGLSDERARSILREVLDEPPSLKTTFEPPSHEWLDLSYAASIMSTDMKRLLRYAEEDGEEVQETDGWLAKFHTKQRQTAENL